MGHTDSLGVTAENLAEERFELTAEEQKPEELAAEYDISREAQDRFALHSHQKAVAAQDEKRFRDEIVPVTVKTRKGDTVVEADEGPDATPRWRSSASSVRPSRRRDRSRQATPVP